METKKIKFKHHIAGKGGWSEWVYPKMESFYFFKCCDCGLIHEMEFGTLIKRKHNRGTFQVVKLPNEIAVMFRARRMKIPRKIKALVIKSTLPKKPKTK